MSTVRLIPQRQVVIAVHVGYHGLWVCLSTRGTYQQGVLDLEVLVFGVNKLHKDQYG